MAVEEIDHKNYSLKDSDVEDAATAMVSGNFFAFTKSLLLRKGLKSLENNSESLDKIEESEQI